MKDGTVVVLITGVGKYSQILEFIRHRLYYRCYIQ